MAGPARLQLAEGLPRLLKLRDDKMLEGERDWLHVLGVSKLSAGLVLTALQIALRKHVNENIQISYDSASPFLMAAFGNTYYTHILNNEKLSMCSIKSPKSKDLIGYQGPWPWHNPVSNKFSIDQFVDPEAKHTWTLRGYLFQMYHNTYEICQALLEAQYTYLMPDPVVHQKLIPSDILELADLFDLIFTSETPHTIINDNLHLLNNAISRAENQFRSDFFSLEKSDVIKNDEDLIDTLIDSGSDGVDETMKKLQDVLDEGEIFQREIKDYE